MRRRRWGKGNGDQREACFLFLIFISSSWLIIRIGRRKGFSYALFGFTSFLLFTVFVMGPF
jgi:hypothetical protein